MKCEQPKAELPNDKPRRGHALPTTEVTATAQIYNVIRDARNKLSVQADRVLGLAYNLRSRLRRILGDKSGVTHDNAHSDFDNTPVFYNGNHIHVGNGITNISKYDSTVGAVTVPRMYNAIQRVLKTCKDSMLRRDQAESELDEPCRNWKELRPDDKLQLVNYVKFDSQGKLKAADTTIAARGKLIAGMRQVASTVIIMLERIHRIDPM